MFSGHLEVCAIYSETTVCIYIYMCVCVFAIGWVIYMGHYGATCPLAFQDKTGQKNDRPGVVIQTL